LFEAGILLKALNAVWEISSGLLLLLVTHTRAFRTIIDFAREEFIGGDHDDAIFRFAAEQLNHISVSTRNFIGIYLLIHGMLNVFLAYNLYRNRLWAYPLAAGVAAIFCTYQIYRLLHTHSLILLCVTIFDIAFIILTMHEYRYQLRTHK
jgi:uncharacterized membrane protein